MQGKEPKPGERLCALLRASTGDQKDGVESQRNNITAFAVEKKWPAITKWYEDQVARRHMAESRPDFQQLLADCRLSQWDWVVVDSQWRLGTKHAFEYGKFINEFLEAGVNVYDVGTKGCLSDPDNPVAVLMGMIGAMGSREDQKRKARDIMRGKIKAAQDGRYPGGPIPYGLAVGIFDKESNEKWRFEIESCFFTGQTTLKGKKEVKEKSITYTKIIDGRRETVTVCPAKDKNEIRRYVMSQDQQRIETLKLIFQQYTAGMRKHQIATLLNKVGVPPIYGTKWRCVDIWTILRNPIYTGVVVGFKEDNSHFTAYRNGHVVDKQWINNKPVQEKRNKAVEDRIIASYKLPPVVSQEVFDDVQTRIKEEADGRKKRSPRSLDLWLKNLVYCDHCGKAMRAWKGGYRAPAQYFCSTYSDEGKDNACGCLRHQVSHALLEGLVQKFLAEAAEKVAAVLPENKDALKKMKKDRRLKLDELLGVRRQIKEFILSVLPPEEPLTVQLPSWPPITAEVSARGDDINIDVVKGHPEDVSQEDIYTYFFRQRSQTIKQQLEALDAELDKQMETFGDSSLPKVVKDKARMKMEQLSADIEKLTDTQKNLLKKQDGIYNELLTLDKNLAQAQVILAGESKRAKSEAVGKVINRISCRFRHTGGRGRHAASVLEWVQVVPRIGVGEAVVFKGELLSEVSNGPSPHKKQGF